MNCGSDGNHPLVRARAISADRSKVITAEAPGSSVFAIQRLLLDTELMVGDKEKKRMLRVRARQRRIRRGARSRD